MFGYARRERELLRQLLEQEKYVNRLKAKVAELENAHLKLLEEHLQCKKEEVKQPVQPAPAAKPTAKASEGLRRGNYPQDINIPGPPITKERLDRIFGKKDGN